MPGVGRSVDSLPANYRDALLAIERHERPDGYPGLTPVTRRAVNDSQFLSFARGYWADWRHTKIRLYRYLLEERAAIAKREADRWTVANLKPEDVTYQQVTNGIIASAASEFCQYAEDLAVLSRACRSDHFFARDLTEAKAGKMQERVKSWSSASDQDVAALLRFPLYTDRGSWPENSATEAYVTGLQLGIDRLRTIGNLYKAWEFHFMAYKHGLLLALTEADSPTEEFFESRQATLRGHPQAFDNGAVFDSAGRGEPLFVLPPGDHDVMWNAAHLAAERNLLRLIPPEPLEADIRQFESAASFVSQLMRVM
jgi:hypothetical protein